MARPSATFRIVGGANIPTSYLRISAIWPLAVLTVTASCLSLWFREPLQRTGAVPLDAAPADVARVFPTRGMWTKGVGFAYQAGREWYFWTHRAQRILTMLDERG